MHCYRHPNEEVVLRCGKCERPICPKCTIHGPAGARCPECSSLRSSPLFQVSGTQMVLAGVAGLAASFFLGYLLSVAGALGFFQLWGALLAGGAVGEVVLRASGRKRGIKMEVLTGIATLGGIVASCALWYGRVIKPELQFDIPLEQLLQGHMYYFVSLVIMLFSAVSRVRFL